MNPRSRVWTLTIPKHSTKDKKIAKDLFAAKVIKYILMGKDDYKHYQCYLQTFKRITFTVLKGEFPKAHIEIAKRIAEEKILLQKKTRLR